MSVQYVSVLVPPLRPVPPGAAWLAEAGAWLLRGRGRVAPTLGDRLERARAAWHERRDVRRRVRQREELIALAGRYASTQPEFAKELVAAANHEPG